MATPIWRFSNAAEKATQDACASAVKYHNYHVHALHLALALLGPLPSEFPINSLSRSLFRKLIARVHGNSLLFERALTKAIVRLPSQNPPPNVIAHASSLGNVLRAANSRRSTQNETLVAIDHLIFGVLLDSDVRVALEEANIPKAAIKSIHIATYEFRTPKLTQPKAGDLVFVTDTASLAAKGMVDPVIGRDEEIRRLITVLSRRKNNNAILVGQGGIGKTSIVNGLAQRIAEGDVPVYLKWHRIRSLNVRALSADAGSENKFEEGIGEILKAIDDPEPTTSVFIDDFHLLVEILDGEASKNGGNYLLRSMLLRKKLHHYIATTTPAGYKTLAEKHPTLLNRFVVIPVTEPNISETISILRGLKHRYETNHGVAIADDALFETAALAGQYFASKSLPQSAIDLVDKIAATTATTRIGEPEELKMIENERNRLVTSIADLERNMNLPSSHAEETRLELSSIEKTIKPLRDTYGNLLAIRTDLLQQALRLEQFRSIHAEGEEEGNVPEVANNLYSLILETQAHIEKAKQREEAAMSDLLKHIKDPSTRLFFANTVGSAQVRHTIRKLTGRKPIPGLANLITGAPTFEWKGKEDSTFDSIPLSRDGGTEIPPISGLSLEILANIAQESLHSTYQIDRLQNPETLPDIIDSSKKEVERKPTLGQAQAGLEIGETQYEHKHEHEIKDIPREKQRIYAPGPPQNVGEVSRAGLGEPSTSISPGLVDTEASTENSAGKPKSGSMWRKAKISKLFKSKK